MCSSGSQSLHLQPPAVARVGGIRIDLACYHSLVGSNVTPYFSSFSLAQQGYVPLLKKKEQKKNNACSMCNPSSSLPPTHLSPNLQHVFSIRQDHSHHRRPASGIGLATAKLLARQGARLSLADIQQDRLSAVADELRSLNSGERAVEVLTSVVDVRDRSQVDDWMARTISHFGGGALDGAANLADTAGVLNCVRAQLKVIRQGDGGRRGGGSIVNASSLAGLTGFANHVAYSASKHAVIAITRCAAQEEGARGVRVNAVAPGAIATPMLERMDQAFGQRLPDRCALARRGDADEAAQLICFLLADESSFVTGAVYRVDGGWNG
ncbi:hypothetical protein EPUS_03237 [Endocarpon pusillum Z07020]|uniref:Uncharacterized protein n=1 Tax=Endocarpon pusillum (strain Z07020 / HMAS-L-300199) TaxID=1263415 RepID=U1GR63_ENDPU|nr:uncharacterized protein EPUS_03237 [Endocarpon pusillum Z07020]ERF74853.1 hypothetical protein EPUS_03237 [Endocarpon pusillum Z07020]